MSLAYIVAAWLLVAGLYGAATSRHLVHLVLCLGVMQASTYVLLVAIGYRAGAKAPIFADIPPDSRVVDPVVQAMALTDIVVEATVAAVLLALSVQAAKRFGDRRPEPPQRASRMTTLGPLCLAVPMLGAAAIAAAGGLPRRAPPLLAIAVAAAVAVMCAIVVHRASPGPLVTWLGGWHPRNGVALGIDFAGDDIGAGIALFIAVLTVVALMVSARIVTSANHYFDALVLVFLAAAAAFCLTGDLFDLFVFFELFSVVAYVLVGYEIDRRAPLEGALSFAVTNTAGSILLLVSLSLLYGQTGALNLAQIGAALHGHPPDALVVCAFAPLLAGFCVKAAIVPFHFWTADAYAVAPTSVCILLAGAMSELGLLAIARTWWTVFDGTLGGHEAALRTLLVAVGTFSALVGGAMCLVQHHLRRMLAFATIAHLGMLLVGIGLLSVPALAGAAIFVVGDGLVRAGMFVAVGLTGCGSAASTRASSTARGRSCGRSGRSSRWARCSSRRCLRAGRSSGAR